MKLCMVITPRRRIRNSKKTPKPVPKRSTVKSDNIKTHFEEIKPMSKGNFKTFIERRESSFENNFDTKLMLNNSEFLTSDRFVIKERKNSMEQVPKRLKSSIQTSRNLRDTYAYEMSLTKVLKKLLTYDLFKAIVQHSAYKYNKEDFDKIIYLDYRNVFFENKEKSSFRGLHDNTRIKNDIKTNNIKIITFILILIVVIGAICTLLLIFVAN
jgi:hypothetical protein